VQTSTIIVEDKQCQATFAEVGVVTEPTEGGVMVEPTEGVAVSLGGRLLGKFDLHLQKQSVIVQGQDNVLSNFYAFNFVFYHPEPFKSVEHAFQYYRACDAGKYDLAESIRHADHAGKAKSLSKGLVRRSDLKGDIELMKAMIHAKAQQLATFRDVLRETGDLRLVHSTYPSDKVWGSGLHHGDKYGSSQAILPGRNEFGVLLMELRGSLGVEGMYGIGDVEIVEPEGYDFVVLHNGEKLCSGASRLLSNFRRRSETPRKPRSRRDSVSDRHNCYHCNVDGHTRADCTLKGKVVRCFKCGQTGHKYCYCPGGGGDGSGVRRSGVRVFYSKNYKGIYSWEGRRAAPVSGHFSRVADTNGQLDDVLIVGAENSEVVSNENNLSTNVEDGNSVGSNDLIDFSDDSFDSEIVILNNRNF
jgi:ribA/ribD-fused uncharacterized protein